jgi:hypothetical protein
MRCILPRPPEHVPLASGKAEVLNPDGSHKQTRPGQDILSKINMGAGELRVESLSYLPPHAILRSFVVVSGNADYVMQIEFQSLEPGVTFLARKWRDSSPNLLWLGALKPAGVRCKFARSVDGSCLTRDEVEKWFRYLLSGLRRKFRPPKRTGFGRGVNPFRADWQETDRTVVKTTAALSQLSRHFRHL